MDKISSEWDEEWADFLDAEITEEEIESAIRKTKNKAAGKDDVRIEYIKYGGIQTQNLVKRLVKSMWSTPAENWEATVKLGVQCSLYKGKGDRNSLDSYRGVVLLSMLTRLLTRVVADRLSKWAEARGMLSEMQSGFRKNMGTEDAI